jgi:hypothetical protein
LSSIWEYLLDLSNTKKTTIIITTHYIDETRQASVVSIGYAFAQLEGNGFGLLPNTRVSEFSSDLNNGKAKKLEKRFLQGCNLYNFECHINGNSC